MEIFKSKETIIKTLQHYRSKSIGFVPTMGALHRGHMSLIGRCKKETDITVASVFVNPTQFNDKDDYAKYPRDLNKDLEMLIDSGCDFVFAPSVDEMYPPQEDTRIFDFGTLNNVMESKFRPGHFNGVAQIVCKLFEVVMPNKAYFGEKDFQQLAIIRRLVTMMNYPIEIINCETVRENDGLAMSSRNALLTSKQRENAATIYKTLILGKKKIGTISLNELQQWIIQQIDNVEDMKTEYFEIVDRNTLMPVNEYKKNTLQGCIAVKAGNVRLIDNIQI